MQPGLLTVPYSHFQDIAWGREVSDGIGVFGGRLDAVLSEHQSLLVTVGENAAHPLESPLHGVRVCDDVECG